MCLVGAHLGINKYSILLEFIWHFAAHRYTLSTNFSQLELFWFQILAGDAFAKIWDSKVCMFWGHLWTRTIKQNIGFKAVERLHQ